MSGYKPVGGELLYACYLAATASTARDDPAVHDRGVRRLSWPPPTGLYPLMSHPSPVIVEPALPSGRWRLLGYDELPLDRRRRRDRRSDEPDKRRGHGTHPLRNEGRELLPHAPVVCGSTHSPRMLPSVGAIVKPAENPREIAVADPECVPGR